MAKCDVCKDEPLKTLGSSHASPPVDDGRTVTCPKCGKKESRY